MAGQEAGRQPGDGAPGGGGVDDGVPEAHEGKDEARRVGKRPGGVAWVGEGVDAEEGGGELWGGKGG